MKLLEKFNNLKAAASLKLEEAGKLLEQGDMDAYRTVKSEYESLKAQVEAYKEQIDAERAHKNLDVATEQEETPVAKSTDPVRPPFEEEDKKPEPAKADSVVKSVAYLRYGDTPESLNVVMRDIYGPSYIEKREAQKSAFAKYLR